MVENVDQSDGYALDQGFALGQTYLPSTSGEYQHHSSYLIDLESYNGKHSGEASDLREALSVLNDDESSQDDADNAKRVGLKLTSE